MSFSMQSLTHVVLAGALLSSAALANANDHRAELRVGPLIGGEDLVVDFHTTYPNVLGACVFDFALAPNVSTGPYDPILGIDLLTSTIIFRVVDSTGRDRAVVPTSAGDYGPVGIGVVAHFQYLIAPPGSALLASNVVSVELEPTPVFPGFLVDDANARLPVGFDTLAAGPVAAGDLDKDGAVDFVLMTEDDVFIWMNDGTGNYTDESSRLPWPSGAVTSALTVIDVNKDSYLDIVVGGGFDDSLTLSQPDRLWINDRTGNFAENLNGFVAAAGLAQDFEFGDYDLDGDLDVALGVGKEAHVSTPTGAARLFLSDGAYYPTFTEVTSFSTMTWNDPEVGALDFAAGDVDSDGDLDLVASRVDTSAIDGTPGQTNVLLINDGTATFTDASASLSPNLDDNTQGATLADFDMDGDLDLVFANSHATIPGNVSGDYYINQGGAQGGTEGTFVEDAASELEISTPADWIRLSTHAQDMDADGDLDLVLTVHDLFAGANQLLFLNDGGAQGGTLGVMKRQFWFNPGDFISFGAAFADIDLDGDIDMMQTAQGVISGDPLLGDRVRLYINGNL